MDYQTWQALAVTRLRQSENPRRDAEILLGFVTGQARTFLIAFGETRLKAKELQELERLLSRREQGEPIAYLVREREFWSLPLTVSPATLIPRSDTECLVEQALARLPTTPCAILDLGTGTGAIALALASERADCEVTGIELREDALSLARHNAHKLAIDNVRFLLGNWFEPLVNERFALIASNPPYIAAYDPHLNSGDVRYEPSSALVADTNGLADLMTIVCQASNYLTPQGWLVLEHGWQQASAVRALLCRAGFNSVSTHQDYGGHDRVTLGQW